MSCFIVDNDTIDRTISAIELQGGWARYSARLSVHYLYDWTALGRAMRALNLRAFRERYEGRHEARDDLGEYQWQGRYVTRVEGYKALRCFLYQCSEGQVPEDPLFLALDAYADSLAVQITEATEAYQRAAWT